MSVCGTLASTSDMSIIAAYKFMLNASRLKVCFQKQSVKRLT